MSSTSPTVVCDAGPIIHLDELDSLSLLADFAQVLVPEAIFLTDDAAARLAAVTLGYRVHGSIGILLRAVRRRQRTQDEVVVLLRSLPTRSTLHIRLSLLQGIISKLESQV